jgi:hypothetical protein
MGGGRTFESYTISSLEDTKYVKNGRKELAFILDDERFLHTRDCSNKFKKHLGFTLEFIKVPSDKNPNINYEYQHRVIVHDKQKLMLFRIKYGL